MSENFLAGCLVVVLLIVLAWAFCGSSMIIAPISTTYVEGSIPEDGTYIKRFGSDSDHYMVIVEIDGEEEIMRNGDSSYFGKYNSADFNRELEALAGTGKVCTFKVYGYRWPLLSEFRNIVSIESCQPAN